MGMNEATMTTTYFCVNCQSWYCLRYDKQKQWKVFKMSYGALHVAIVHVHYVGIM